MHYDERLERISLMLDILSAGVLILVKYSTFLLLMAYRSWTSMCWIRQATFAGIVYKSDVLVKHNKSLSRLLHYSLPLCFNNLLRIRSQCLIKIVYRQRWFGRGKYSQDTDSKVHTAGWTMLSNARNELVLLACMLHGIREPLCAAINNFA